MCVNECKNQTSARQHERIEGWLVFGRQLANLPISHGDNNLVRCIGLTVEMNCNKFDEFMSKLMNLLTYLSWTVAENCFDQVVKFWNKLFCRQRALWDKWCLCRRPILSEGRILRNLRRCKLRSESCSLQQLKWARNILQGCFFFRDTESVSCFIWQFACWTFPPPPFHRTDSGRLKREIFTRLFCVR